MRFLVIFKNTGYLTAKFILDQRPLRSLEIVGFSGRTIGYLPVYTPNFGRNR
jgi:hypothetical protein